MRGSPTPGRVFLLVVVLLVTCYFADWTDDFYSFAIAERYTTFENANGARSRLSGGSMNLSGLAAGLVARRTSREDQQSILESVFGSPLGSPTDATDSRSTKTTSGYEASAEDRGADAAANAVRNEFGARPGFGTYGNANGFGSTAGSRGLGLSGQTGFSLGLR